MESYGASSLQQGSGPMNPMLAMIQRQQQEQQQYEALSAGTTMGVAPTINQDSAVMNSPQSGPPPNNSIGNNIPTYMNGDQNMGLPQEQYQRQLSNSSSQLGISQQFNEMSNMYRANRSAYSDMSMMQQPQQLFNIANMSPSHSPAPNNTQYYSNVDLQSNFYSEPSINDLQTSYMNMIPPAAMQSMDNITSMQLPASNNTYISNSYPQMSYSPVPQSFMASSNPHGNVDHCPPAMKMETAMTSNLTSMPVQAPTLPNSMDNKFHMMARQDTRASPTNPIETRNNQPSSVTESPTIQSPLQSNAPVTYIPKTRQVESYGGVDIKYFEKFDIRPAIPTIEELGMIDITALNLSLKSGIKMEMTNALNTLTTLTLLERPLLLVHCEDLLDTILNHLRDAIFTPNQDIDKTHEPTTLTYADLFEMSLMEMKSLIPRLEPTSSHEWLSSRELRLCLFNILRNLSFAEENINYLATHPRLNALLIKITQLTRTHPDDTIRCMDILEFRKCILTIYANISIAMTSQDPVAVDTIVYLIHDFVTNGTDTYYAMLAMESWNKFSVHDHHRRMIGTLLFENEKMGERIQGIWTSLIMIIRRQFYMLEMGMMVGMNNTQLGTLELVVMGLYNVVALADLEYCERLIRADPGMAMTLLRICLTLGEANNHYFRVVAQRAMELVYALVLGGGVKVTELVKQHCGRHHEHKQQPLFPITWRDLEDEDPGYKRGVTARARVLMNHTVLQEKLMMAMLKPASDYFILSGFDDLMNLMADMVFYD